MAATDYDDDLLAARRHERTVRLTAAEQGRLDRALAHHATVGGRSVMGAHTIGDLALAEPGCEVWAKHGTAGAMRTGGEEDDLEGDGCHAKGGIVIEIASRPCVDTTTGEKFAARVFHCFDYTAPAHQALCALTETQIDPGRFDPPHASRIRYAYRRICRHVGNQRGTATYRHELELVAVAAKLAAIVALNSEIRS